MQETTFEMFARLRAQQVIDETLASKTVQPLREDDPCFDDYCRDVDALGSDNPPISPSAIFFEVCLDACNELLVDASNILDGYRVVDTYSYLKERINAVLDRLGLLNQELAEGGGGGGFAVWLNSVLEAERLHQAAWSAGQCSAHIQDSYAFQASA